MEDVELDGPTPVGELVKQGIQENDVKKLMEAGYHTVESVAFTPRKTLVLTHRKLAPPILWAVSNRSSQVANSCASQQVYSFESRLANRPKNCT